MDTERNMDTERKMEIAAIILQQLGGGRFKVMTGAKDFYALDSGLQFSIPGNMTKNRINRVRVHLTPADTYTVEFFAVRKTASKAVATVEDVYNDQLAAVFEENTGLYTRL